MALRLVEASIFASTLEVTMQNKLLLAAAQFSTNTPSYQRYADGVTHEFFGTAAVVTKAAEAQAYAGQRLKADLGK